MYWTLVVFFGFVALSAAAVVLGGPESSAQVVYASAVVFIAASAGLIGSTVLAVRHREASRHVASGPTTTARPTGPGPTRRQIDA